MGKSKQVQMVLPDKNYRLSSYNGRLRIRCGDDYAIDVPVDLEKEIRKFAKKKMRQNIKIALEQIGFEIDNDGIVRQA